MTGAVAELHSWASRHVKDPEILYAVANGYDCSGAILEHLLGLVQYRLDGWKSEVFRSGTAAWATLVKFKTRRDPSPAALALSRALLEALRDVGFPLVTEHGCDPCDVRRLEFEREGQENLVRTGCVVEINLVGTGIARRLVVFAEE